jgi:protein-S-isoprenylcysteine O-methyltransferase Ste14
MGFTAPSAIRFMVLFAWPIEYGAPMTRLTIIMAGIFVLRRQIQENEVEMPAIYCDAYAGYMPETDAVIPNVW